MQANTEKINALKQQATEYIDHPTIAFNKQESPNNCFPPIQQLQRYTSELEDYLKQHVAGIHDLRKGLFERGTGCPPAGNSVASERDTHEDAMQGHVQSIQQFLKRHIHNIEALQSSLGSTVLESRTGGLEEIKVCTSCANRPNIAAAQTIEREHHSTSYSTIVLMSTFTAGLIVAFLQLMYDMLPPIDPNSPKKTKYTIHYHLGFGFGFVSLVWNLCVAMVAGANTVARAKSRGESSTDSSHRSTDSTADILALENPSYDVSVIVDDGSATIMSSNSPQRTLGHQNSHEPKRQETRSKTRQFKTNRPLSAKQRYARRSVAFAFAQFFGAATFGVCIGLLYYILHSGHVLVFVPMVLLTGALVMAGWHLIRSMEGRRKRLD
ncbi:hypothetical protein D9619_005400 [Psilocybe cf. subviscida]|uniref:Uncharacterized protein n=1 Tax=Psilocybe cf. subviscida TaxID=2480587 RepID=A0A8H5FB96_9AGAR|nr:hypothetical protein D9619_005400 [Psilocybe cf. subviscida]